MNPLLTDFYQVSMTYAYWKNGRQDEPVAFEAFFRKCPFKGRFAIFAGLDELLKFLAAFKFEAAHLDYLKSIMPSAEPEFFDYLAKLDCSKVTLTAFDDGRLCFPNEPLVSLTGPMAVLQLVETPLLNFLNFPTLMATNGARMKFKAGEKVKCVEFGLRRAQGPNGALVASKYSYLGGFEGSSNVYSGFLYGIPISGTMAHSFVMSFSEATGPSNSTLNGVDILKASLGYRK